MKKSVRTFFLALVVMACFVLMIIGTLAAIPLLTFGIIFLGAGLGALEWHVTSFALFGLMTVALCSVCCFGGLMHIFNGCLEGISRPACEIKKPIVFMTLISLAATACIFLSTQMPDSNWFMAACVMADVQHIFFVIGYLRRWRRRRQCDKESSLQPGLPSSSQASSC